MPRRSSDHVIKQFLFAHVGDGSRVIDVGCGTGWTAIYLSRVKRGCRVDGVDIDELRIHRANALFRRARQSHLVQCLTGNAEQLAQRLGYGQYEVAVSIHSLHHYRDQRRALRQIRLVLKPGGCLLLAELTPAYGESIDDCPRYSRAKIRSLLNDAKLRVRLAMRKPPGVLLILAAKK